MIDADPVRREGAKRRNFVLPLATSRADLAGVLVLGGGEDPRCLPKSTSAKRLSPSLNLMRRTPRASSP